MPDPQVALADQYKCIVEYRIKTKDRPLHELVMQDFREGLAALDTVDEQITYCKRWIANYRPEKQVKP